MWCAFLHEKGVKETPELENLLQSLAFYCVYRVFSCQRLDLVTLQPVEISVIVFRVTDQLCTDHDLYYMQPMLTHSG